MKKKLKLKYLTPLFLTGIIPFFPGFCKGIISIQQLQRLNQPRMEGISDRFVGLELSANRERMKKWDAFYDFDGRFYPGEEGGALFSMQEAYLQRRFGRSSFTAGRKIVDWNPHEKFWGLGVLNANRGFSYMDFEREGLMGLHFERESGGFGFHLFASLLHIPQLNPTFRIRDGSVGSVNEWSALPFREVSFNGNKIPINYTLDDPDIGNLVLNESVGAKIGYSWKSGSIKTYAAYKPENMIRVNATGYYDPNDEKAHVRASPFANHHLVWGGNVVQDIMGFTTSAGLEVDHPRAGSDDSFEFEALKIIPVFTKRSYAHSSLQKKLKYGNVGFHYVELLENQTSDANAFASKAMWVRATGVSLELDITEKLNIFLMGKYDLELKDSLFKNQIAYKWGRHVSLKAGFEMVKSEDSRSFWTPFKTNDSVYSAVGYQF